MNKKNKTNSRLVVIGSLIGVLLLGVTFVSAQGLSFADKIAKYAGEMLGMNLSDRIQGNLDLGESEPVLGGTISEKWIKQGNLVTYVESGTFRDASTTLIAFMNPFGSATTTGNIDTTGTAATSTITKVKLDISGAASTTLQITCGAASTLYGVEPTYKMIDATLATDTAAVLNNDQWTSFSGLGSISTGTTTKMLLTHDYSYFRCFATSTSAGASAWGGQGTTRGLIGDTNTFDGTWSVTIEKNLQ